MGQPSLRGSVWKGPWGGGGGRKGAVVLGYGVQLYLKERDYNCIQTGHTQSLEGGGLEGEI